jgi:hypothetical protein
MKIVTTEEGQKLLVQGYVSLKNTLQSAYALARNGDAKNAPPPPDYTALSAALKAAPGEDFDYHYIPTRPPLPLRLTDIYQTAGDSSKNGKGEILVSPETARSLKGYIMRQYKLELKATRKQTGVLPTYLSQLMQEEAPPPSKAKHHSANGDNGRDGIRARMAAYHRGFEERGESPAIPLTVVVRHGGYDPTTVRNIAKKIAENTSLNGKKLNPDDFRKEHGIVLVGGPSRDTLQSYFDAIVNAASSDLTRSGIEVHRGDGSSWGDRGRC